MKQRIALRVLFAGIRLPMCLCTVVSACLLFGWPAWAADKNGVSPQTISLPSGPGSIQGLGESFQPQLNSGSGSYSVPIQLPKGPAGFAPGLSLQYHTGNPNGCLGIGWKLFGPTMVSRNMDNGLPLYVETANGIDDDFDGTVDNPEEIDRFSGIDLEELVPLPDATFRSESEESFLRYERTATGWRARTKSGLLHEFGTTSAARIESGTRQFAWLLERTTDLNGNTIEYHYRSDPSSPGQKYCREIRWARDSAFYAVVLSYDDARPDVHSDFRSGFEVRTGLRLARIDVIAQGVPASTGAITGDLNEDGESDSLIRRYVLEYQSMAQQSFLHRVTMLGSDGVTALPSVTLAYTAWAPPSTATMRISTGEPGAALDSDNVELIDMNRDGLPDLLQATAASHRVHLNLGVNAAGRLAWDTVGTLVGNAPSLNLNSTAVHLADHSADGEADLISKVNSNRFECFVNSGHRTWEDVVTLRNTDSWPRWPFENTGSRTMDTDHNRMHDILFTSDNSYRLWMLMPGGRYGREVPLPVLDDGTRAFSFEDPGARIADANGDRITDLVWIQSTRVVYWASCGRGNFEGPIFLPFLPFGTLMAEEIARSDFADVNGDGLADLIVVRPLAAPTGVHYRLNLGQAGFDARRTIAGLPATVTGDTHRCADMNGNGSVDLLISNSARPAGTREQFLDFVPGVRPGLLRQIDNGLGLVTTLDYESSVDQMVRARNAGQPWSSTMPISVSVVKRMTQDDSRGNQIVREYSYRDPHFDPVKQEFRGFGFAEFREVGDASAGTRITTHQFDTGKTAECLKGKVLVQEVLDGDRNVFLRAQNSWSFRQLAQGPDGTEVCFPFNDAVDTHLFEGTPVSVRLGVQTTYDDLGNVIREGRQGVFDSVGDEVIVEREFLYRPEIWLMDRPLRERTIDGDGALVADATFAYDDRGRLTEHRKWLNTEDRFILFALNAYDEFGNLTRGTNANGASRSVLYDAQLHTYAVVETVHLSTGDLVMNAAYDLGYGTVTSAIDFSGAQSTFVYDALARLVVIHKPGGARTEYEYRLGNPISSVVTRMLESAGGGTHDSYSYSDGFGRALGSKVEASGGRWRFLDALTYNDRALPEKQWLPHYTSTSDYEIPSDAESHTSFVYDVTDRVVRTTNPDGSVVRSVFEPLLEHTFDERDNEGADTPTTRRSDGLSRLVEVIERNGTELYLTRYVWDPLGNLTRMTDAAGNQRLFDYDSLRRKIRTNDPDRGIMTYTYDDVGNLTQTVDARGQAISYGYDEANRIIREDYVLTGRAGDDPVDVTLRYDTPSLDVAFGDGTSASATFTRGRLAAVTDLSGEEHMSYDARGNIQWTVKRIRDPLLGVLAPYTTQFVQDLMNRVTRIIYPDNDRVRLVYNGGSFLERVDGDTQGRLIVEGADHEATGQLAEVRFGNGVFTTYTYDSRDRLSSLITAPFGATPLMDYAYSYDAVSNVTRIEDRRPTAAIPDASARRNSQTLVYDDLYRLREMRFGSESGQTAGVLQCEFDAIGNLTRQSASGGPGGALASDPMVNQGVRSFGGSGGSADRVGRNPGDPPGPHALTATGTGATYEYDENGNMLTLDGAELSWDAKNRLATFRKGDLQIAYAYDYKDRRVSKSMVDGATHAVTLYIDQHFELRPHDAPVKFVFSGPRRIAQVKGTLDPTRPRLQRFRLAASWNLMTMAVHSSQSASQIFGADAHAYRWTGTEYVEVNPGSAIPVGQSIWVEVPTARLVSALGTYFDDADPISVPQGQQLAGWSRLEPFKPSLHGAANARATYYDAHRGAWVLIDATLPSGVSDGVHSAPSASGIWFTTSSATDLVPAKSSAENVLLYHGDHLGSVSVVTDVTGNLSSETAYYPFGHSRQVTQPQGSSSPQPYGFADKERENETGLQNFGMRYYAPHLAIFTRPDPQFVEFTDLARGEESEQESFRRFLTHPQMGNLYAYASGNPLKYVDLDGREIEASDVLRKDVPLFKDAVKLLARTEEGQRILKSLGGNDFKVHIRASLPNVKDAKVGEGISTQPGAIVLGQQYSGWRGEGKNLKANEYAVLLNIKAHWQSPTVKSREDYVYKLAETIFHELRHAEGDIFEVSPLAKSLESAFGIKFDAFKAVHNRLDQYQTPSLDSSLAKFQSELGAIREMDKIEMGP